MKPSFIKRSGIVLGDLPPEHPLRNRPLIEVGACYRYKNNGSFGRHKVKPAWRIARSTFNSLGPSWTSNAIWYSTIYEAAFDSLATPADSAPQGDGEQSDT